MDISSRIPKQKEVASVYAVIVLMIYGWTILKFNYNLPGWLYFLNVGEILSVFAYSMVTNLFESLLVLAGVIALAFFLPRRVFSESFIACGASLSILAISLLMYIANQFSTKQYYPAEIIRWSPALLILAVVIAFAMGKIPLIRKALEFFADRAIIFLYISIPVSVLSLVAVLFQNIF